MGMSYMRAWNLVQDMNKDPKHPMIEMSRGSSSGGNATIGDDQFDEVLLRMQVVY
jgi:molybdate transport repressor ModE-like protein